MGFRLLSLGFRGVGFRVLSFGFRGGGGWGGFEVNGVGFRGLGPEVCRVVGFGFRV